MDFSTKYEKQITEALQKTPHGPHKYLWCEPDLVCTFRLHTLKCACGKPTAFRFDDGCEIPVCSDECLTTYKTSLTASTIQPTPEQPQLNSSGE